MATIEQLPEELVTELLTYLSPADTNNLRLSCKSLYENSGWYYKMKKRYFIHFGYSDHEIIATLMKCHQIILQWFLIGLDLSTSAIFQTHYCDQIEKLTVYYCDFTYDAFKRIVGSCPKLRTLEIHLKNENHDCFVAGFISDTSMIAHQNLETFRLLGFESNLWRLILVKIFNLFSNIRTLTCTNDWDHDICTYLDKTAVSLPDIHTEAPSFKNIERLLLNIIIDSNLHHNLDNLSQCRLKEIHFRMKEPATYINVLPFLCKQKQLESVELTFHSRFLESVDNPIKITLFMILAECPCLRKIVFTVDDFRSSKYGRQLSFDWWKIDISYEEFCTIVESSLEYLDVPFSITNIEVPRIRPLNKSLQTLILHSSEILSASVELVLIHFQDLKHLKIYYASDNLLHTIFKYQSQLLSLYIAHVGGTTDFGFTGKGSHRSFNDWSIFDEKNLDDDLESDDNWECDEDGEEIYSIKRLKNLQCLTIPIIDSKHTIKQFVFPALKHLNSTTMNSLFNYKQSIDNWLKHFAINSPSLKIIQTCSMGSSTLRTWEVRTLLGQYLNKLSYLSVFHKESSDLECFYSYHLPDAGTDRIPIDLFKNCSLRLVRSSLDKIIAWNSFTGRTSCKSFPPDKRHYFECSSPIHHSKEFVKSSRY